MQELHSAVFKVQIQKYRHFNPTIIFQTQLKVMFSLYHSNVFLLLLLSVVCSVKCFAIVFFITAAVAKVNTNELPN